MGKKVYWEDRVFLVCFRIHKAVESAVMYVFGDIINNTKLSFKQKFQRIYDKSYALLVGSLTLAFALMFLWFFGRVLFKFLYG